MSNFQKKNHKFEYILFKIFKKSKIWSSFGSKLDTLFGSSF